jgi:hypothetical protein
MALDAQGRMVEAGQRQMWRILNGMNVVNIALPFTGNRCTAPCAFVPAFA